MDLVDIDKVLDDFELNENDNETENFQQNVNIVNNSKIHEATKDETAGYSYSDRNLLTKNNENLKTTQQQSSSNSISSAKNFVNVSNVFSSLNEYVSVEINETPTTNVFAKDDKPTIQPKKSDLDESSHSSDSIVVDRQAKHNKIKKHPNISKPRPPVSSSYSNSTSPGSSGSSTPTSSRHTSPTTSTNSSENDDEDDAITKTNEKSNLIPNHQNSSLNEENNQISSELRTNSYVNNKTNTMFSSSSSYCYNENNSSDVTFSNEMVSLNETSSLSSLVNISQTQDGDVKTVSENAASRNDIDSLYLQSNDQSILLNEKINESEDHQNKKEEINKVQKPTTLDTMTKAVVGFESTMDDVSDTELESYLQELEFESNTNQIHQTEKNMEEEIESMEVKDIIEDNVDLQEDREESVNNQNNITVDLSEDNNITSNSSGEESKEQNIDNISQASTVECNEIVSSHTDIDDKIVISDESVIVEQPAVPAETIENLVEAVENKNEIIEKEEVISPVTEEGAQSMQSNEDKSLQTVEDNLEKVVVDMEQTSIKESEIPAQENLPDETHTIEHENNDSSNLSSTSTSQPKRPSTLNIQSNVPEQISSPGQTPPLRNDANQINDQSQLSTSSSDDIANPTINPNNSDDASGSGLLTNQIGKISPYWVPDSDALNCMQCNLKFSIIKRRHHCRACGKVLCSACCSVKAKLEYLGDVEARICKQCHVILTNRERFEQDDNLLQQSSSNQYGRPNPNNPMEYCSRLPPYEQVSDQQGGPPISVMVPVGVLKREGAPKTTRKEKNVIFSDGIRPGCDLTELDSKSSSSSYRRKYGSKRAQTPPDPTATKPIRNNIKLPRVDVYNNSYIPEEENGLPPLFLSDEFKFVDIDNNAALKTRLRNEELMFAIQRNFFVMVKIVKLTCCINRTVINFTTQGMRLVGQDEIIILLELNESALIPKDIFLHLNDIYMNADKGLSITELGLTVPRQTNFLGSKEHGGFLYIRPTFQCLQELIIPESPYLVGILIHRWEVPWAKVFPLRLMLRLGALYRYYPSPLISELGRDSVYAEIAQTVINLLADFRTYSYTLATIRGMTIHMENRQTTLRIPKNRYDQVIKAINNSSDHILALGGVFSKNADGHLVCIQNTESGCPEKNQYSTHAINIQGKPCKITGASFLILNGALKSTSGLSGKCTIVEDGLMVQILQQTMVSARDALKSLKDFNIVCGPVDATPEQTETVSLLWVDDDLEFNVGVISPIDSKKMDGIPSIRVHKGLDYPNTKYSNHMLRWTEVFILKSDEDSPHGRDQVDVLKISEKIAKSTAYALEQHLDLLATCGLIKLGLRVTLDPESVCYEAGSKENKLPAIYMNALDNELITILHREASNLHIDTPIILELIFHILDKDY